MKIVIDLPEKMIELAKNDMWVSTLGDAVKHGTPYKERPHGHWIKGAPWSTGVGMGEQYGYYYTCSECGHKVKGGYTSCDIKFCQECGSDNRKRGDK